MDNGERQQRQQTSAPATTLLPPPRALDTAGDVWKNWKTWRQEFELFATATYLKQQPKEVQAATFLMIIGEHARKTYSTFAFAPDEEKSDAEVLKLTFEAFYKPALNLGYHEFRFGKRDQNEGESFNDWLTDLRVLAKRCEFGELEEHMLRSLIILGIREKELQEKLVSENASFAKTVEMCRSREHGKKQCEEIQARAKSHYAAEMNALSEAKEAIVHAGTRKKGVPFPRTLEEKTAVKEGFLRRGAIPGVIGCVDGSLLAIITPKGDNKAAYMCRKGFYALNSMFVSIFIFV
ncbi:hypothetical protein HPB49_025123 [Dermacentor silvarum]|uniref:Uncharacterized protein n=1 Tax=Dermacentor silvarum TaxID=543639 RepID=A0ACB8D9G8_DERSI|nr:hypothetical protein HPB49_025123 [Dermacentor silvarum]